VSIRIGRHGLPERHAPLSGPPERCGPVWIAQFHAARFGCRERLLRAPRDGFALLLGYQRHDANGQIIGLGHVARQKPHAASLECQQEGGVAAETLQFGDDKRRAGELGEVERLLQYRPAK